MRGSKASYNFKTKFSVGQLPTIWWDSQGPQDAGFIMVPGMSLVLCLKHFP